MSQIEWNINALASSLSKTFLREVMDNFRGYTTEDRPAEVRFGITGTGVQPNYQITYYPGDQVKEKTLAFRGNTHSPYRTTEVFNEERISDPFKYEEIEKARNG